MGEINARSKIIECLSDAAQSARNQMTCCYEDRFINAILEVLAALAEAEAFRLEEHE